MNEDVAWPPAGVNGSRLAAAATAALLFFSSSTPRSAAFLHCGRPMTATTMSYVVSHSYLAALPLTIPSSSYFTSHFISHPFSLYLTTQMMAQRVDDAKGRSASHTRWQHAQTDVKIKQ
jgi:hypothetical protein